MQFTRLLSDLFTPFVAFHVNVVSAFSFAVVHSACRAEHTVNLRTENRQWQPALDFTKLEIRFLIKVPGSTISSRGN